MYIRRLIYQFYHQIHVNRTIHSYTLIVKKCIYKLCKYLITQDNLKNFLILINIVCNILTLNAYKKKIELICLFNIFKQLL